jgi:predicted dehydrogenase
MIGAGGHASRNIYPNFYFLRDAEVVANADLDEGKARDLARKCGIPNSYTDYRAMLQEQKPDGVMVCVNKEFHATAAIDIMKMGYHVYTEKPNAPDFARSKEVLATTRETKRICMVGYKKRFSPSYSKARAIIEGEDFGVPSLLTIVRTKGPTWGKGKDEPQASYILDWGCHAIDLLSYLFGPVARVQAFNPQGTTNAWAVNVHFANGAVGSLCLTNRPGPLTEEVAAFGSKGIRIDVSNAINMQARKGSSVLDVNEPEWSCGSRNSNVEQGFLPELQAFADAIRDGTQPASTIETATHTMAVYDAIISSRAADGAVTDVEGT